MLVAARNDKSRTTHTMYAHQTHKGLMVNLDITKAVLSGVVCGCGGPAFQWEMMRVFIAEFASLVGWRFGRHFRFTNGHWSIDLRANGIYLYVDFQCFGVSQGLLLICGPGGRL